MLRYKWGWLCPQGTSCHVWSHWFSLPRQRNGHAAGISGRDEDAVEHPYGAQGGPTTKNFLAQKVNNTAAEKPWYWWSQTWQNSSSRVLERLLRNEKQDTGKYERTVPSSILINKNRLAFCGCSDVLLDLKYALKNLPPEFALQPHTKKSGEISKDLGKNIYPETPFNEQRHTLTVSKSNKVR